MVMNEDSLWGIVHLFRIDNIGQNTTLWSGLKGEGFGHIAVEASVERRVHCRQVRVRLKTITRRFSRSFEASILNTFERYYQVIIERSDEEHQLRTKREDPTIRCVSERKVTSPRDETIQRLEPVEKNPSTYNGYLMGPSKRRWSYFRTTLQPPLDRDIASVH